MTAHHGHDGQGEYGCRNVRPPPSERECNERHAESGEHRRSWWSRPLEAERSRMALPARAGRSRWVVRASSRIRRNISQQIRIAKPVVLVGIPTESIAAMIVASLRDRIAPSRSTKLPK